MAVGAVEADGVVGLQYVVHPHLLVGTDQFVQVEYVVKQNDLVVNQFEFVVPYHTDRFVDQTLPVVVVAVVSSCPG